jgi:hypothetical protein
MPQSEDSFVCSGVVIVVSSGAGSWWLLYRKENSAELEEATCDVDEILRHRTRRHRALTKVTAEVLEGILNLLCGRGREEVLWDTIGGAEVYPMRPASEISASRARCDVEL